MLHWFAGQKPNEGPHDPDATGYIEPPETPAPVFAVRAFKHAIFGTPQATHPKPRRHSNTENGRPKNVESKPSRPAINRPKSTNDAHTLARQDSQTAEEPLASPTKGILLTPGAAAARKKNVTFGEHVVDNEEKRPLRSGLPEDCPGKFPSPWNPTSDDVKKRDLSPEKGKNRSKLTEALEQVRDESRKRKAKGDKRGKGSDDEDIELAADLAEPRSESGKYWKREYDIYRTNTQREVKKLITKQKAAKSYAQMKDSQCTELADQLRQEQRKVEKLEVKTTELASLVKDLQAKLHTMQEADKKPEDTVASRHNIGGKEISKTGRSDSLTNVQLLHRDAGKAVVHQRVRSQEEATNRPSEPERPSAIEEKPKDDPVQRPSEPYQSMISENRTTTARSTRGRSTSNTHDVQLRSTDDIWAQLDSSSNPVVSQPTRPASAPRSGLAVTSGTEATPLKTLNINTLPTGPTRNARGSPQSMDVECKSTPDLERVDSKNSHSEEEKQPSSPLLSLALPLSSSEPPSMIEPGRTHRAEQGKDAGLKHGNISNHIPTSSPFQFGEKTAPPRTEPSGPRPAPDAKLLASNHAKENIAPLSKSQVPQDEPNVKPSVAWSSMNAPPGGRRTTSVTGKDVRQLSQDRIEAARARIAARGRVTS